MKKQEKIFFVDNLVAELSAAKSAILINYSGLGVVAQQELKKKLREAGARMIVVKNTLLKRAGEAAKIDKEVLTDTVLTGQNALVVATGDPVAPISILGAFAKEHETPKFKVGVIDGSFTDEAALIKIAALPGRDALLGQVLGALMASPAGLVSTLQSSMNSLVYVLKAKAG